MLSGFLQNMTNLALSMPTNLVILFIICLILKIFARYSWMDCVKVIIGYMLLCVIFSLFGLTMPSFITIFNWIKAIVLKIWYAIW